MNVQTQENVQLSEARKASLPAIMLTLQVLRTNKEVTDEVLHPLLDRAASEAKYYGPEAETMFRRLLLHIGDVSRQHNILKKAGIASSKGGAGERSNFRSILRWWEKYDRNGFYTNLKVFTEFTVLENLLYDQIRTDRMKGTIKKQERMGFDVKTIASFFADEIRNSKNPLIARHLPKYVSHNVRVRINKKGERIQRKRQSATLAKNKRNRLFINMLCDMLNWSLKDYKEYRKRQNTPEQLFSSKKINELSKDIVMNIFDRMTSSQRFRVAHTVCDKDGLGHLQPKQKWQEIGLLYIEWEGRQTKIADEIRKEADPVKKEKLTKEFKVKATGLQTIDLLAKIIEGRDTTAQINNTYQAMLEKMDLVGNVFPVIDGSGSMGYDIGSTDWQGWYGRRDLEPYDNRYGSIKLFDVAAAMAIAFSTKNPNPDFQNTFGWFSDTFAIVGESKYKNTAPNQFVSGAEFKGRGDGKPVISDQYTFTENLTRIKMSNPGHISCTNIGATIDYFVRLHKQTGMTVEQLPQALLFITDNEGNSGMSPRDFMTYAATIGWHPLVIFWGLKINAMKQYEGIPNCMFIGGFNESVLGQVLRGIKTGSILPETELWSINDDPRYTLMK